jgi:hypothetical protein
MRLHYVRTWISHWIVDEPLLMNEEALRTFVRGWGDDEMSARAAHKLNLVSWVRERKYKFDSLGPWARRQLIRASLALAKDERRHWCEQLERNPQDELERWVTRWIRSQ